MKTVIRSVLALVLGVAIGSVVNMGIIIGGSKLVPPPPGVDVSDAESIAASIHLFEPKHFVVPLLAHAAGTLVGAVVAYVVASRTRSAFAWAIGVFFLAGGIAAAIMLRPPAWFTALDLLGAYLPMAWLATLIGRRAITRGPTAPVASP